jgi:hypothetical protein
MRKQNRSRKGSVKYAPAFISLYPLPNFSIILPILMRILYQFILSLHQFSSFLPWCNSISSLLFLYYLNMFNTYPNIPLIIPTVVRYNTMFPLFFFIILYIFYIIIIPYRSLNFTYHYLPSPHFCHCFSHHFPIYYNFPESSSEG